MKKNKKENLETFNEKINTVYYTEEMEKSYIDYAMSVIVSRAVPDVRDGLKPVQRRILYAMKELGLSPNSAYKKSARIVGDAMGKYHPHGDSSIYEALVNMSKDWNYNAPLIDGHGNFGSIEGDGAAAMRYTEAKLAKFADDLYMQDLDKDIIDFVSNFDDSEKEPSVLPVRIPSLLINGTEGIAVGMATHIPSHNFNEVLDAVIAYMDNNKITIEELMQYIKGPDFATGGVISNKSDLLDIYKTGTGKIRVRGKIAIETDKKTGKHNIIISEIPCTMVGAIDKFMETVANLYREKKLPDLVDIKNNSDKDGIRIVIELKKNADVENILGILYKKAKLEDTFGVSMLAISNGQPLVLNLKEIIKEFVEFQVSLYERKYSYLLTKEEKKKEIKEGLIKACDCIDLIIEILRGSKNLKDAKDCLMTGNTSNIQLKNTNSRKEAEQLCFSEVQADAILDMKLQRLIGLELEALKKEFETSEKNIKRYKELLGSKIKMKHLIKNDIKNINNTYIYPRKTKIIDADQIVIKEVKIEEQKVTALIDRFGYIKIIDFNVYQKQKEILDSEYKTVIQISNMDKLCLFTDKGVMHSIKIADLPIQKPKDKGAPLETISNLTTNENILMISSQSEIINKYICFGTSDGMVKLVNGAEFEVNKRTVDSTKLADNDKLIFVKCVNDEEQMLTASTNGYFLRFPLSDISVFKKASRGVRAMKLNEDDKIAIYEIGNTKSSISYNDKEINFDRVKLSKRDGKPTKIRI